MNSKALELFEVYSLCWRSSYIIAFFGFSQCFYSELSDCLHLSMRRIEIGRRSWFRFRSFRLLVFYFFYLWSCKTVETRLPRIPELDLIVQMQIYLLSCLILCYTYFPLWLIVGPRLYTEELFITTGSASTAKTIYLISFEYLISKAKAKTVSNSNWSIHQSQYLTCFLFSKPRTLKTQIWFIYFLYIFQSIFAADSNSATYSDSIYSFRTK